MNTPFEHFLFFCLAVIESGIHIYGIIYLCDFFKRHFSSKKGKTDENDYIRKYLDSYLQRNKPGFSVFINGAWGSGKTFFINKYKTRRVAKCYVSLFGVVSKKEFEYRLWKGIFFDPPHIIVKNIIILSLSSVIGISIFSHYAEGISNYLSSNFPIQYNCCIVFCTTLISSPVITSTIGSISILTAIFIFVWKFIRFKAMGIMLRKRFLVFDDFERTEASCDLVLSWINEFVEHIGCATIIIGNEEAILEKITNSKDSPFSKEDYQKIKEKIIGKEFQFTQTDEKVCRALIMELKDDSALKNTLGINLTWFIINLLDPLRKKYNHQTNYRALASCFGEFDYYFNKKSINDNVLWKELIEHEIWKEIILRFMSFMYVKKVSEIKYSSLHFEEENKTDSCIIYTKEFVRKVLNGELLSDSGSESNFREIFSCWQNFSPLLPSRFWNKINESKIIPQTELTDFFKKKLHPEISIVYRWSEMYYLDDKDYATLWDDTTKELEHPSLQSLEEVVDFIKYICIAFEKQTLKETESELKKMLQNYVTKVLNQDSIISILYDDFQYHDKRVFINDICTTGNSASSFFISIKEEMLNIMMTKHKEGQKVLFDELLNQIKTSSKSFQEWYYKNNRIYQDIFSLQKPDDLWQSIYQLSTHDFRECLENLRGHIINTPNGIMHDSEIRFWRKFLNLMKNEQNQWAPNNINIWKCDYIEIFYEIVDKSLDDYQQTNGVQEDDKNNNSTVGG